MRSVTSLAARLSSEIGPIQIVLITRRSACSPLMIATALIVVGDQSSPDRPRHSSSLAPRAWLLRCRCSLPLSLSLTLSLSLYLNH